MANLLVNNLVLRPCHNLVKSVLSRRLCSNAVEHTNHENTSEYESHHNLYDAHIPTSTLQKVLLTLGSSVLSISNPYRHDMVAVLGETTGLKAAQQIRDKMMQDPEGISILHDKPRISSSSLDYQFLESLPKGTLGHAYLAFLKDNNVTPDTRRPVHYVDDAEIAYVIQRYREVHDFNHTLLGMPTNLLGEVCVKWVEAIQTGLPMCVAGALLGPLRLSAKQRQKYLESYLQWSISCGQQAKFLMNIYFEKRWQQNLDDLRKELNIPELPQDN
ncbi:hypothetical protein JTE90_008975 [Oedothorax gibbosus]|uniref:Ubiquinone biosynthesis protein COQ4 homolog, mitochondrial n=1 Tax=Oedothorax gibbosus TaxID=931172 RepID=A0AAV6UJJ8_9ARAC|nr:hypothetical protein JTE90_008975 [Oedothorax gibbosus]